MEKTSMTKTVLKALAFWFLFVSLTSVFSSALAEKDSPKIVIGIDLGTTYSCVGVMKGDHVDIIANDQGNRITPSWVSFNRNTSERLVGEAAKNQAALNPEGTVYDVERLIGRKFDDAQVQKDTKFLPYHVVNKDGKPYIKVQYNGEIKVFCPEEISAMELAKMKETAESVLGTKVEAAVVTVPAYFNDTQEIT